MKTLALASLLALAPLGLSAATIDFTAAPSGAIDQDYGDIAGVLDVIYEMSYDGGLTFSMGGIVWAGGYYGSLNDTNALIGPDSAANIMRVTLQALGGNTITSFAANVAYWTGIDAFPLTLSLAGDFGVPTADDNIITPGLTGFGLSGGPWTTVVADLGNDWNVGYQSISYELAPIPLPAGAVLLLGALGGLGLLRRRKSV